jgi:fibro-slime domain-containing protein
MHGPADGVIDFDAQRTALAIAPGNVYQMDVFHAERHTDGSNFKFTTNIACFTPVIVR